MGLNEYFNQVCVQILLMDPLRSINVVLSMVSQDEKQREVITLTPIESPVAFVVQGNTKNSRKEHHIYAPVVVFLVISK